MLTVNPCTEQRCQNAKRKCLSLLHYVLIQCSAPLKLTDTDDGGIFRWIFSESIQLMLIMLTDADDGWKPETQ